MFFCSVVDCCTLQLNFCAKTFLLVEQKQSTKGNARTEVSTGRSWLPFTVAGGGRRWLTKIISVLPQLLYGTLGVFNRWAWYCGRFDLENYTSWTVITFLVRVGGDMSNKRNKQSTNEEQNKQAKVCRTNGLVSKGVLSHATESLYQESHNLPSKA